MRTIKVLETLLPARLMPTKTSEGKSVAVKMSYVTDDWPVHRYILQKPLTPAEVDV